MDSEHRRPIFGAVRTPLSKPSFVAPMLPSLVLDAPAGDDWIHEIKFDGYRTLLAVNGGQARAFTRNGYDWSDRYGPIVEAAAKLRCRSAIIDGEVISPGADGASDFHGVMPAISRGGRGLVFVAFDLLFLDDKDLRTVPLEERRRALRKLMPRSPKSHLQFSEEIAGDGAEVFAAADRMGLEGIVSKRRDSRYRSGRSGALCRLLPATDRREPSGSICPALPSFTAADVEPRHARRDWLPPTVPVLRHSSEEPLSLSDHALDDAASRKHVVDQANRLANEQAGAVEVAVTEARPVAFPLDRVNRRVGEARLPPLPTRDESVTKRPSAVSLRPIITPHDVHGVGLDRRIAVSPNDRLVKSIGHRRLGACH